MVSLLFRPLPSAAGRHDARHALGNVRGPANGLRWGPFCDRTATQVHASSLEEAGPAEVPLAVPAAAAGAEPTEFVEVGVVGAPHGVRGEMKVQPLTDFPEERLGTPGTRWLRTPVPKIGRRRAHPPTRVELEYGRTTISKGNEVWIVKLEGVESPEEARLLRGHSLLIPAAARAELEDEDEFYVQDLVGLRVFLQSSGEELGAVVDLFDGTGTHDVLRIKLLAPPAPATDVEGGDGSSDGAAAPPRYVLLPFARQLVPVVDLAAGRMEVLPPEGLLDLASSPVPKVERQERRGKRDRRRGGRSTAGAPHQDGAEQPAVAGSGSDAEAVAA